MNNLSVSHNLLVVGIDPHKDSLGVSFVHPDKDEVLESFITNNFSFPDTDSLIKKALSFAKFFKTNPVFVLESTNVFWRPLFYYLKSLNFNVVTVNGYQTNSLRKTLMRKTKTDKIDAKLICDLYKQGKFNNTQLLKDPLFSMRELTRLFKYLTDIKAMLLNRVYAYILQVFPEFFKVMPKTSFNSILSLLEMELVHPLNIKHVRIDKLSNLLQKASHGKLSKNKAVSLKNFAKSSFGMHEGKTGFSFALKILARLFNSVDDCLSSIENDAVIPMLASVPNTLNSIKGLGPVSQASFISELGNYKDFPSANAALAFFGLDPKISQSGKSDGLHKHISKAGTKYGRESMFIAAQPVILHNSVFTRKYKKLRKSGCCHKEAKVIIAADLIKICFAMLRDYSAFNPSLIH